MPYVVNAVRFNSLVFVASAFVNPVFLQDPDVAVAIEAQISAEEVSAMERMLASFHPAIAAQLACTGDKDGDAVSAYAAAG